MSYTLGIDPGLDGALVLVRAHYNSDELVAAWDMPTAPRKKGREIDIAKLWDLLLVDAAELAGGQFRTVIEQVRAMPRQMGGKEVKMGAQSSFNFGEGFGIVRALVHALGAGPVGTVEARVWKKRSNLIGEPKQASLDLVLALYPGEAMFIPKRGRLRKASAIGRAEAALIAIHGRPITHRVEDLF